MRRIPTFDPSVATTKPYISIGSPGTGSKILLYNESPYNLDLDFYNGDASVLHAWEARYWLLDGETPQIGWSIDTSLNVTNPPISAVMGELYNPNEQIQGSYPMALIRQASVGNPGGLQTTVSSATSIINDNNPVSTQMIESTAVGQSGSCTKINNDGIWQVSEIIGGALVQWLKTQTTDPIVQLGAISHLVEILGNLTIDGNTTHTGTSTFTGNDTHNGTLIASGGVNTNTIRDNVAGNTQFTLSNTSPQVTAPNDVLVSGKETVTGQITGNAALPSIIAQHGINCTTPGDTYLVGSSGFAIVTTDALNKILTLNGPNSGGGGSMNLQVGGVSYGVIDSTGIKLNVAGTAFKFATGNSGIGRWSFFDGTGTGTYNHNLGAIPSTVIPITSVVGSATQGYDTLTTTQAHVTLGAANNFRATCWKDS